MYLPNGSKKIKKSCRKSLCLNPFHNQFVTDNLYKLVLNEVEDFYIFDMLSYESKDDDLYPEALINSYKRKRKRWFAQPSEQSESNDKENIEPENVDIEGMRSYTN